MMMTSAAKSTVTTTSLCPSFHYNPKRAFHSSAASFVRFEDMYFLCRFLFSLRVAAQSERIHCCSDDWTAVGEMLGGDETNLYIVH
jgi:hypothetical protein